jgi:hypothetical protein
MREHPDLSEVQTAWLNQPGEDSPVEVDEGYRRRTGQLFSTTRAEVLSSAGAALFFAVVMVWRFAPERDRVVTLGCAAVAVWAVVTVLRFQASIRRNALGADVIAATGVAHYRSELVRRRAHLRSVWIWHGPLWLAIGVSAATLAGRAVPGRLWEVLPLLVLLAVWAAAGVRRRLRQAAELQQEIDDLSGAPGGHGK